MNTKSRATAFFLGFLTLLSGCLFATLLNSGTVVNAEPPSAGTRDFPIKNDIDKLVLNRLREEKIEPSVTCTDEEFLRRAYLDITGVIPTRDEVRQFLNDRSADKRAKLADKLLESGRYAEHWSVMWSDLLREHSNSKPQEGTERGSYHRWIIEALQKNMPYDQFVRELITAKGIPEDNAAVNFYLRDEMNRVETSNAISTAFMGTRMACAQCHDHPFDKWTQSDFHGLMSFFGRTIVAPNPIQTMLKVESDKRLPEEVHKLMEPYFKEAHEAAEKAKLNTDLASGDGAGMGMGMMNMGMLGKGREVLKEIDADKTLTKEQQQRARNILQQNQVRQVVDRRVGEYRMPTEGDGQNKNNKNSGEVVRPTFPWDPSKKVADDENRRKALADMITSSRQFAAVQVNRLWARLMGRGLVEPLDDFREKNQPTNPELLDYLAGELINSKFDNHHVLRLILNSSTYQRSSMPNTTNKSDSTLYSHQRLRKMSAEQVFDSILVATGHNHGMDAGAKDIVAKNDMAKRYMRADEAKGNIVWAADLPTPARTGTFMNEFNQPDREQVVVKRDDSGSITQALELINGREVNKAITNSPLNRQLIESKAPPAQIITDLYHAVLSRNPTPEEGRFCMNMLRSSAPNREWIEDMHWALINTREFTFIK